VSSEISPILSFPLAMSCNAAWVHKHGTLQTARENCWQALAAHNCTPRSIITNIVSYFFVAEILIVFFYRHLCIFNNFSTSYSKMGLILLCSLSLLLYTVYEIYYRLYLSPIAHIPGPKLAALTRLFVHSVMRAV
jgi:hypothetical protein